MGSKKTPIYVYPCNREVRFAIEEGKPSEVIPYMRRKGFLLPTVAQALDLRILGLEYGNSRSEQVCTENSCLTRSMVLFRSNKIAFSEKARVDYFKIVPDSEILERRIEDSPEHLVSLLEYDYHDAKGTEFLWQGSGMNKHLEIEKGHKSKLWKAMVEDDELLRDYSAVIGQDKFVDEYWSFLHMEVQADKNPQEVGFYGLPIELGKLDDEQRSWANARIGNISDDQKMYFIR